MSKDSTGTIPCPTENEGNIVNVNSCCPEKEATQPKNYIFYEKEPPRRHCCFDVYITRCWLTHNRDINPAGGIILMGYANQQTGVAPGLASYLHIHPKHGWVNLNQQIGTFTVVEGEQYPVLLRVDALEWGQGLDGASDIGSDKEPDQKNVEILLDCTSKKVIMTQLDVKLQRPNGGDAGRIAVEISAFKSSCCS